MKTNKLTFQSEDLVVDWISFKFQKLENSTVVSSKNKSEVLFVIDNSH
jgi:hypothetical protein